MRLLAAAATLLVSTLALGTPGQLDPAFGNGGKVVVPIGNFPAFGNSTTVLASGKILIAGGLGDSSSSSLLLVRLESNGTVDASFGMAGKMLTNDPAAFDVAEQPDGKILAAAVGGSVVRLLRFNADGTRDVSFGSGGVVDTTFIERMRLQADGKIVTLGSYFNGSPDNTFYFVLKRYLANGMLDTTFGAGGRQDIAVSTWSFSAAKALAVQPDGKYVASGYTFNGANYVIVTIRAMTDGSPDATFGSGGEVVTPIGSGHATPSDMLVQPDGRIVVVGDPIATRFRMVRYLPDGTLDPGFGTGGIVETAFGTAGPFTSVALQPDGRIVAAGWADTGGSVIQFVAMRYLANGQLDPSFGSEGKRVVIFGGNNPPPAKAADVALQADGKIVLAGSFGARVAAARLDTDGQLDQSFASVGRFWPALVESTGATLRSVKVRPNGKIIAGGAAIGDFALVQVNPDGSLDQNFGESGKVTSDFFQNEGIYSLALQPDDGYAVVAGLFLAASPSTCRVTRYNQSGAIDTTFGTSGSRTFTASELEDPRAVVALQPDRKIVVACPGTAPGNHAQIIRLHPSGATDASFGVNGTATVNVGPGFDLVNSIAIQPDGRIVVAGKSRDAGNRYRMLVVRFEADGSLDPSQVWQFSFTSADAYANSVIVQGDGKIVVAGTADIGRGVPDIGIIRLLPDGTLDPFFGSGGKVGISWGGLSTAEEVLQAPDGRLYVAGTVFITDRNAMGLLRLRADGSLDASFGDGGRAFVPMEPFMGGWSVALQPDGKPVVAGGPYRGPGYNLPSAPSQGAVIARFLGGAFAVGRYDFNANARPDVIFRNSASGDTFVWRMNGLALQSDQFMANVDPSWRLVGHGDFNGDGKNDVVWRNMTTGAAYVWYLNDGVFVSDAFLFTIDPVWMIEAVDDFDHDGHPDFLFRHQTSGVAFIWYYNNTTPVRDQFLFSIDNSWIVENTGDFNNDGYPDFFFRNTSSGLGFVWYWDGTSLGASNFLFSIDPVWQVVQIVDWNNDGKVDLVFRNANTGVTFVWYTDGTALQGSDFLFQVDPVWEIVPYR